jgi:hypothetical protein
LPAPSPTTIDKPTTTRTNPSSSSLPSSIDESWRVYEREGNPCVICDGTGRTKCLYCFGDGVVYIGTSRDRDGVPCPQCAGLSEEVCPRCHGSGVRPATRIDPLTLEVVPNRTNADVVRGTYPDGYPPRPAGSEFPVPDFEQRDAEEAEAESEAGKQKQRQDQLQQQQPGAANEGVADSKQQTWRGASKVGSVGEPGGGQTLDTTKAGAGEFGAGASSTVIEPAHPVV